MFRTILGSEQVNQRSTNNDMPSFGLKEWIYFVAFLKVINLKSNLWCPFFFKKTIGIISCCENYPSICYLETIICFWDILTFRVHSITTWWGGEGQKRINSSPIRPLRNCNGFDSLTKIKQPAYWVFFRSSILSKAS